ncbi:hypothetical protein BH18ACT17_BH18ACT17_06330 [soil metagenome]
MRTRKPEADTEPETSQRRLPWHNVGLRQRVEGRDIEGIDVQLQTAVVSRDTGSTRKRLASRSR